MLIRVEDLDTVVFENVMAGIGASVASPNPSAAVHRLLSEDRRRFRPDFRPFAWWSVGGAGFASAVLLGMLAGGVSPGLTAPAFLTILCGAMLAGLYRSVRSYMRKANVLHSDLLAGWLPHIELTRSERSYCETLVWLAKPDLHVSDETARAILSELNSLIEHSRRLEVQQAELRLAADSDRVVEIEAERAQLEARRTAATDPQTRESLAQSLALCDGRLTDARAMQPALKRLDAQQEVMLQTLESIHSSLARMEQARQALMPPDVANIRTRLGGINREAESLEAATEEVLSLRRG